MNNGKQRGNVPKNVKRTVVSRIRHWSPQFADAVQKEVVDFPYHADGHGITVFLVEARTEGVFNDAPLDRCAFRSYASEIETAMRKAWGTSGYPTGTSTPADQPYRNHVGRMNGNGRA